MDYETRLRRIEAVADAALAHLSLEDLLDELLARVRDVLEVDTATILLLDAASRQLIATASKGLEEETRQNARVPVGFGFAGRVAARRQAVILDEVSPRTVVNPILVNKGISRMLGVPMLVEGEVVGVLHVGTFDEREFPSEDVSFLQLVADRAAVAARARTNEVDRVTTLSLQRSLLPPKIPERPNLELAARYVPGSDVGVGGDWYDVFTLPTGRLGVVIGDVAGHGLAAAVVMGRLRSALRAYALESDDPADVLSRLDYKAQHFEEGMLATVLYGVFEPGYDRLSLSSAGHPAPVLAAPGQEAQIVALTPDPPIGVLPHVPRTATSLELPSGAVICLYTDGLIERRGQALDEGIDRLRRVTEPMPVESLCTTLMGEFVGAERLADDVALIAAHRTG